MTDMRDCYAENCTLDPLFNEAPVVKADTLRKTVDELAHRFFAKDGAVWFGHPSERVEYNPGTRFIAATADTGEAVAVAADLNGIIREARVVGAQRVLATAIALKAKAVGELDALTEAIKQAVKD